MGYKRQAKPPSMLQSQGPRGLGLRSAMGPTGQEGALRTKIYITAKQGPTHVVEPVTATQDSKFPLPQASLVPSWEGRGGGGEMGA